MPDGIHATEGIVNMLTFRTKMITGTESHKFNVMTDQIQSYLALQVIGGDGIAWQSRLEKSSCMRHLFGQHCSQCN